MNNIRNFCIIAHIDSGKSTLADRFLEITGTVDKRQMKPQYLDKLELERERGITIKMAPVRMEYSGYILNLIDTPGHSDFSYEVSRALAAVEGAILLIDGTKGIQAQTLSNLRAARKACLKIIGAVNKVDLNLPNIEKTTSLVSELLETEKENIFRVSAKTGMGAEELLWAVIKEIPPPKEILPPKTEIVDTPTPQHSNVSKALIFDSLYDDHKGIIAFARVFSGEFPVSEELQFVATGEKFKAKEIGCFSPDFKSTGKLSSGEIGYVATGTKESEKVRVGDTIVKIPNSKFKIPKEGLALPGYKEPAPVVFISFYPDGKTEFDDLEKGFKKLRLNDAALKTEPDSNEALGRGLKVGFLGQLHFEIASSRLEREFDLRFITSFPSIAYKVQDKGKIFTINQPHDFPDNPEKVWQPMIKMEILSPSQYMSQIMNLKTVFDVDIKDVKTLGDNTLISARMPLAELIRDFDDRLKSISAGFASFSYELDGEEEADSVKLEILVAEEVVPAMTRIVAKKDLEREARQTVERLKELLPKQQFVQAIQAKAGGRIVARETISAMRKDVTGYLYGGDRSRKMKLWKKQQRGKEKLKSMSRVNISPETFREILKK